MIIEDIVIEVPTEKRSILAYARKVAEIAARCAEQTPLDNDYDRWAKINRLAHEILWANNEN